MQADATRDQEAEQEADQEADVDDRRGSGSGDGMDVRVNGEERRLPRGRTVAELLDDLELDPRAVVVEVNRDIVRREDVGDVTLEPGDRVEIVQFVGGG